MFIRRKTPHLFSETIRRVVALEVEMLRRVIGNVAVRRQLQRTLSSKSGGNRKAGDVSAAVDSMLLRSLKEHYLEVSKMTPPPVRSSSTIYIDSFLLVPLKIVVLLLKP